MLRTVTDKYKYQHELTEPLASGGQGTVWRTRDPRIAVKIAGREGLSQQEQSRLSDSMRSSLNRLNLLPIPRNIGISLPIAPLEGLPGYSMRLLGGGMRSFSEAFDVHGAKDSVKPHEIPAALRSWPEDLAKTCTMYNATGGLRRRLLALSKCAAELSRLNGLGLIYCDVNMNNIFVSEDVNNPVVWLIDSDNIRFDSPNGSGLIFKGYGAPEIVRGKCGNTSQGDCWAFSIVAFKVIFMWEHPFEGAMFADYDDIDEAEQAAYSGEFPYVLDPDDDSNSKENGIAAIAGNMLVTPEISELFMRTFTDGKDNPDMRPPMFLWPEALARAADSLVVCPVCGNHYYEAGACAWCGAERPRVISADTAASDGSRLWHFVREIRHGEEVRVPRRILAPFLMTDFDTEIFTLTPTENSVIIIRPAMSENIMIAGVDGTFSELGFRQEVTSGNFTVKADIEGRKVSATFSVS